MADDSFKIKKSINIEEGGTLDQLGDIGVDGTELKFHNGTEVIGFSTPTTTEVLENKTIDADDNTILNIRDAELAADADISRSKLAPGTSDHVLINDGSGELSSEATLAKVRGGTGADNSNVTFPSIGTIPTLDSTSTLTNKTLSGNEASHLLNGSGRLNLPSAGTVTVPNITDTLVGAASAQTLGAKTFSDPITFLQSSTPSNPASGANKLYFKSDGNLYKLDSAGNEIQLAAAAFATQAEMEAASSTTVAVTPGTTKYHPGVAKAWVYFNGSGTLAVNASYNVSSVTDNGIGSYTINFTTPFSAASSYSFSTSGARIGGGSPTIVGYNSDLNLYSTTQLSLYSVLITNPGTLTDQTVVGVVVHGDQ